MGITRHSLHKRRATGGKKVKVHKKRKYDMGRAPANTKLSNEQRTHEVRTRGGHTKYRALHLHTGNFSWPGEGTRTPPTQIRCHVHVSRGPPLPIGIHCSTSSSLGSSIPPRPCEHSKHRGEIAALRRKAAKVACAHVKLLVTNGTGVASSRNLPLTGIVWLALRKNSAHPTPRSQSRPRLSLRKKRRGVVSPCKKSSTRSPLVCDFFSDLVLMRPTRESSSANSASVISVSTFRGCGVMTTCRATPESASVLRYDCTRT